MLLTQVVSPRYAIQDDGVLFLLFELCECLSMWCQITEKATCRSEKAFHPGHMIKQGLEACLQSQSSTQKISCRNGILVCNGDNNYRRDSKDIKLQ